MAELARCAFQLRLTDEEGVQMRFLVAADNQPLAEHRLCRHLGLSSGTTRFHLERLARPYDMERFNLLPDAVIPLPKR